jgi:hypothetical protein
MRGKYIFLFILNFFFGLSLFYWFVTLFEYENVI